MAKDCDGNEIKVGDEVEIVDPTGGHRYTRKGARGPVLSIDPSDLVEIWDLNREGDPGPVHMFGRRFRKVAPTKPVWPFKAGDVVECLNADGCFLNEGSTYTIERSYEGETPNGKRACMVQVTGREYVASRFCAPGESRVSLRQRIAELENTLKDTRINTVASELQRKLENQSKRLAEVIEERDALRFCAPGESRVSLRRRIAELESVRTESSLGLERQLRATQHSLRDSNEQILKLSRDLDTVSARRRAWKERAVKAEAKAAQLDRMNDALAREARVTEARVMPEGYVVLTKAAK